MKTQELNDKIDTIILVGGKYWFLGSITLILMQALIGIIFPESGILVQTFTGTIFISSICLICLGILVSYSICVTDSFWGPHVDVLIFMSGIFAVIGGILMMYESAAVAFWILHLTPQIPGVISSFFRHAFAGPLS
jgi:hypothetical protein